VPIYAVLRVQSIGKKSAFPEAESTLPAASTGPGRNYDALKIVERNILLRVFLDLGFRMKITPAPRIRSVILSMRRRRILL
jgi:hypothetical protein